MTAITISIFNISQILKKNLHSRESFERKYSIKNNIYTYIFDKVMPYKSLWLYI